MKLPALDMPDDPQLIPGWLERHLMGVELGELVAELEAVHGPAESPTTLDKVCGKEFSQILEHGLSVLSREQVHCLLKQPDLLLELQEQVLIHDGSYWTSIPVEPELVTAVQQGWQRLSSELGLSADILPVPGRQSSHDIAGTTVQHSSTNFFLHGRRMAATVAAVLLVSIGLWMFQKPHQQSLAWGWNRPGTFVADVDAEKYLDRLAERADEWRQRPHDTPDQLRNDLKDVRNACLTLLDANHDPLPLVQSDELKKRCRKWLGKINDHLAALDQGDNLLEVRQQADDTMDKLVTAIRNRFPV
ncbi:MAG: hypothetical protein WCH39_03475 [Schlesneria sp.]